MAIRQILQRKRTGILWLGEPIPNKTRKLLEQLGFFVFGPADSLKLDDDGVVGGLAGVLFRGSDEKPLRVLEIFRAYAARLLDHGCLVFFWTTKRGLPGVISAARSARIAAVWTAIDGELEASGGVSKPRSQERFYFPLVTVWLDDPTYQFVQHLLRYEPGAPPASRSLTAFSIKGPAEANLDNYDRFMLRRAFNDCSSVHVKNINGHSGAKVLLTHATLQTPNPMARPRPFFVKIGERDKILREWQNYNFHVKDFVPFHLRPRLIADRCELTTTHGILVGDFVEDSECLADCARSGRGATPIGTLFDRTLRGWHFETKTEHCQPVKVAESCGRRIPAARYDLAQNLGAKKTIDELQATLRALPHQDILWGTTHGDLHADNVRVRVNDAILIDFYSTREGPLLSDPASLEASLVVRSPSDDEFDQAGWGAMIDQLYTQESFTTPPSVPDAQEPYAWMAVCVRQIRLNALSMQRQAGQYAALLACSLIRLATKDPEVHGPEEYRRAMGYVVAERLLTFAW